VRIGVALDVFEFAHLTIFLIEKKRAGPVFVVKRRSGKNNSQFRFSKKI
jgi:lipopolysaccharide/colanic/teichoic acid biosynthesis glycosyltransferase